MLGKVFGSFLMTAFGVTSTSFQNLPPLMMVGASHSPLAASWCTNETQHDVPGCNVRRYVRRRSSCRYRCSSCCRISCHGRMWARSKAAALLPDLICTNQEESARFPTAVDGQYTINQDCRPHSHKCTLRDSAQYREGRTPAAQSMRAGAASWNSSGMCTLVRLRGR
jgi:hypothetical protein